MTLPQTPETAETPELPPPSRASLKKRAISGMIWSVATGVGSRVVSLASTLLVTRYIDPKSYGEVSVAYVVTQLASLATSLGVGQYVSTRPHASKKELFHAAFLFHVAGALALSLVYVFRAPLGPIFGASDIEPYIVGYIAATFFERVGHVPESMLIRDMRFKTGGLIGTAGELTYSVLALGLASRGMGGVAIVYAGIARAALRAGLLLWVTNFREWLTPYNLDRKIARDVIRYGMPIAVARLSLIVSRRGDNLAFSALFGPARMGAYNLAYNLADVPATTVGESIGDVLVPSFAKLDPKERPAALTTSLGFVAFAVFPLAAGLMGVSRPLSLLLNDSWQALDVRWMLVVLSLLSIARPIEWTVRVYLQVAEQTRLIMYIEWGKVVGLMAAIFSLGLLGPIAACVAVSATFLASALVYLIGVARVARISLWSLALPLVRPLLCAGLLAVTLFLFDRYALTAFLAAVKPGNTGVGFIDTYLLRHWQAAAGIPIDGLVGVLLYAGISYLVARDQVDQIVALVRAKRKGARKADAPASTAA
jgi:lipopolysaccharide exporter